MDTYTYKCRQCGNSYASTQAPLFGEQLAYCRRCTRAGQRGEVPLTGEAASLAYEAEQAAKWKAPAGMKGTIAKGKHIHLFAQWQPTIEWAVSMCGTWSGYGRVDVEHDVTCQRCTRMQAALDAQPKHK